MGCECLRVPVFEDKYWYCFASNLVPKERIVHMDLRHRILWPIIARSSRMWQVTLPSFHTVATPRAERKVCAVVQSLCLRRR